MTLLLGQTLRKRRLFHTTRYRRGLSCQIHIKINMIGDKSAERTSKLALTMIIKRYMENDNNKLRQSHVANGSGKINAIIFDLAV